MGTLLRLFFSKIFSSVMLLLVFLIILKQKVCSTKTCVQKLPDWSAPIWDSYSLMRQMEKKSTFLLHFLKHFFCISFVYFYSDQMRQRKILSCQGLFPSISFQTLPCAWVIDNTPRCHITNVKETLFKHYAKWVLSLAWRDNVDHFILNKDRFPNQLCRQLAALAWLCLGHRAGKDAV